MAMNVYLTTFVFLLVYTHILSTTALPISRRFASSEEKEIATKKLSQDIGRVELADAERTKYESIKTKTIQDYADPDPNPVLAPVRPHPPPTDEPPMDAD